MVLIKFRANIIPAVSLMFKEAFSIRAINGFGMFKAMRYGVSRGVFSNEAGLGSSTLIHAESNNQKGETQGMWAMLEVFIDTVFLCTITALVILVNKNNFSSQLYGADLSIAAYSTIGEIGRKGIAILTAVFAFTSLSSCSFYGEKSFSYLFGKRYIKIYKAFYIILIFIGCLNPPKIIWEFSDICNGLMAIPNLFAINCLGKEVEYPKKCGMRSAECGMSGKLRFQI
jgi:AGCS family alanine or glycine:cation symporter